MTPTSEQLNRMILTTAFSCKITISPPKLAFIDTQTFLEYSLKQRVLSDLLKNCPTHVKNPAIIRATMIIINHKSNENGSVKVVQDVA